VKCGGYFTDAVAAEFRAYLFEVMSRGVRADPEVAGNVRGCVSPHGESRDLDLARCEAVALAK
jgi:hypothetical protein